MRRREFIAGLGAAARPVVVEAQQGEPMRRIGLLIGWTNADPEARSWLAAFVQGLRELGWSDGIDLQLDERWISHPGTGFGEGVDRVAT
jgi:putative tryptophan/tyrosine transport system substrate-binding protein